MRGFNTDRLPVFLTVTLPVILTVTPPCHPERSEGSLSFDISTAQNYGLKCDFEALQASQFVY